MKGHYLCASAIAVLVGLAACTGEPNDIPATSDQTSASSTPQTPSGSVDASSASTSSPAVPEPSTPQTPYDTTPTEAAGSSSAHGFEMTDVRVGDHDGFDRVVVEFTGGQISDLAWLTSYEQDPATQGKGDPIDLGADAYLRVIVRGQLFPPTSDDPPSGVLPSAAQGNVTGVYVDPVFEGDSVVWIGLDAERGFAVSTLDDPGRLVIDIEE
ncbi:hypothetical protein [Propionimicrobium sp. PCR01-08-3]|uniref:AMIN-like domain-containing (lipo)protein n=1 Tax=Propionimicrobium sp. PCR01-08-3 TaxID=3052086 RepID=UPI00255C4B87|nr:hypothetical protein [Propionimicrobium sp. PCR01-08-3]WIY83140.1 hypothetical protein QQ658_01900 [Propionimicrobium sp. PCR01-08-3]